MKFLVCELTSREILIEAKYQNKMFHKEDVSVESLESRKMTRGAIPEFGIYIYILLHCIM